MYKSEDLQKSAIERNPRSAKGKDIARKQRENFQFSEVKQSGHGISCPILVSIPEAKQALTG